MKRRVGITLFLAILGVAACWVPQSRAGSPLQYQWEESIALWLKNQFPEAADTWRVKLLTPLERIEQLGKPGNYTIQGLAGVEKPKKVMSLMLLPKFNQEQESVSIQMSVARYYRVAVANRVLKPGTALSREAWRWEERLADSLSFDAITKEEELTQQRAKKVIGRNEILSGHGLEREPDVEVGKPLTLRVCGQGVVIRTDATCLKDARIGDLVECKQIATGQVIKARVVNANLAEIDLPSRW